MVIMGFPRSEQDFPNLNKTEQSKFIIDKNKSKDPLYLTLNNKKDKLFKDFNQFNVVIININLCLKI